MRARARGVGVAVVVTTGAAVTSWLAGRAALAVAGDRTASWTIGRAAGITSYVLLVALVMLGLVLSHPGRARLRGPSVVVRIRVHVSLAALTLAFVVLHVVVLATDDYAGVGWRGAVLPMGSGYRPVPVTLGVIGAYAGLLAGVTAALAGRLAGRVWWPVHKVAVLAFVLAWLHGLLVGSDSTALSALYAVTGLAVLALAVTRYVASTPADRIEVSR